MTRRDYSVSAAAIALASTPTPSPFVGDWLKIGDNIAWLIPPEEPLTFFKTCPQQVAEMHRLADIWVGGGASWSRSAFSIPPEPYLEAARLRRLAPA